MSVAAHAFSVSVYIGVPIDRSATTNVFAKSLHEIVDMCTRSTHSTEQTLRVTST